MGGLKRARRLDDLARLLIRIALGGNIRDAVNVRCTFELIALAGVCLFPLAFMIVTLLLAMVLIPICLVAAVLAAAVETILLVRLLYALHTAARPESEDAALP